MHFSEDQWVDYVRGLADEGHMAMRDHLASGCSECGAATALFEKVATLAAHEAEHRPPNYAVRSVKAYFSLQNVERESGLARLLGLDLAYDSSVAPATVGTRNVDSDSRQLVYYGNDYALTLRMDYDKDVSLGGELLHRDTGPVSNVPALLMSGHRVVGYSLSGELGDFHMNCGEEDPLRLRMLVNDDRLIEIDLDWPAKSAAS